MLVTVLLAGCSAPPEAPPAGPAATATQIEIPPPSATAVDTAVPVAPASASAAAPEAPPAKVPTIGDTTCATDADCAIATRDDCCDCCDTEPAATSAAWLAWFEGTHCPKARCASCDEKCPHVGDPGAFVPVCVARRCSYVKRP